MPALIAMNGPAAGVRFEFEAEAVIGRSPACEIALYDSKVSRRHARLRVDGGRVLVLDLESRNGTLVNDERLERERELQPGDRLRTGEIEFLFEPSASTREVSLAEVDVGPASAAALTLEQLPALLQTMRALLTAASPATVVRRGAEEAAQALKASRAAVLLKGAGGPAEVAATIGGPVAAHRALVAAALERGEATRAGGALVVPLLPAGAPGPLAVGALVLERETPFEAADRDRAVQLCRLVAEALAAARERSAVAATPEGEVIVGSSRALRKALEAARRAATSVHPVLVTGERGTGKSLLARWLHDRSGRREGPFVAVDARLPPGELAERLFGREPDRPGALERADGGTLFLAEIGVLSPELGEGLARAFASRTVARLESERLRPSDVQLVASSSLSLSERARSGAFDPDLLRRLSAHVIELPALRERAGDVPQLVAHVAARAARRLRRAPPVIGPEALALLESYAWEGNVRELRNVVERVVEAAPAGAGEIVPEALPRELRGLGPGDGRKLAELVERLERDAIAEALRRTRGKKIRAAALLGISRPTLDKKIADYGLEIPRR